MTDEPRDLDQDDVEQPDAEPATLRQALALIGLGRHEAALDMLTKHATDLVEEPNYWGYQALALFNLGRYDVALQAVAQYCARGPDEGWGYRMRSYILTRLGRHDEAFEDADQARRLDPFSPRAHLNWATTAITKDRRRYRDQAVQAIEDALALESDDADLHTEAADAFEMLDLDNRARQHYHRALELNPAHHVALYNLGRLDFIYFRFLRAESLIAQSAGLDPQAPESAMVYRLVLEAGYRSTLLGVWAGCLLSGVALFGPDLLRVWLVVTLVVALTAWSVVLLARSRVGLAALRVYRHEPMLSRRHIWLGLAVLGLLGSLLVTGWWVAAVLGGVLLATVISVSIAQLEPPD